MTNRWPARLVALVCLQLMAAEAWAQTGPAPTPPLAAPAPTPVPGPAAPAPIAPAPTPQPWAAPPPVVAPAPPPAPVVSPAPQPTAAPVVAAAAPAPAPAPVASAVPPPATPQPEADGGGLHDDEAKCAAGPLCLGPVFTFGVFNLLGIGVHARYGDFLGFGLDYQVLPTLSIGNATAGLNSLTIDGRLYPFGGAFFLSGGLWLQTASFTATAKMNGSTARVAGSITVPAFKLGVGFMGHDGFVMGIDLALGIPFGSSSVDYSTKTSADPTLAELQTAGKKDIKKAADFAVNALPFLLQVNLIRIGYLF